MEAYPSVPTHEDKIQITCTDAYAYNHNDTHKENVPKVTFFHAFSLNIQQDVLLQIYHLLPKIGISVDDKPSIFINFDTIAVKV